MSRIAQTAHASASSLELLGEIEAGLMNERSPYLSSTSMSCFLAGGAAGAALRLLLAPQSGKATRQMMAGKLIQRTIAGSMRKRSPK